MSKLLKILLVVVALVIIAGFALWPMMKKNTKKHSPEETIEYRMGHIELELYYNRPSKKGREIFGDLVPYGKVWRTGANEPTTFEFSDELWINNKPVPGGKYTLVDHSGRRQMDDHPEQQGIRLGYFAPRKGQS